MTITEHREFEDLIGPYVLDALDKSEKAAFEMHLSGCDECEAEVITLQEALVDIAPTLEEFDQSHIWARIASTIESTVDDDVAKVIPFESKKRFHLPKPSTAVASIAIVAAFAATTSTIATTNSKNAVMSSVPKLQNQILANIVKSPNHKLIKLTSVDGKYQMNVIVSTHGVGYVIKSNLPPIPKALTYQLWGIKKTGMTSISILGPVSSSGQFTLPTNSSYSELAVSVEPAGGSVAPTSAPLVSGIY